MSTTELIFNSTKFYPVADSDTSLTANGKTYYAVPSKITIKEGTSLTYPVQGTDQGTITNQLEEDLQVDCVGANANHYFFVANLFYDQNDTYGVYYDFEEVEGCGVGEVLKSDCKNIVWGGKHLLSHLYRAFRAITARMAVIA